MKQEYTLRILHGRVRPAVHDHAVQAQPPGDREDGSKKEQEFAVEGWAGAATEVDHVDGVRRQEEVRARRPPLKDMLTLKISFCNLTSK